MVVSDIILLGVNHLTAPVELRECLSFSEEDTRAALTNLQQHPMINEVMIYSTCNRVEVLAITDQKAEAIEIIKNYISERNSIPREHFEKALYLWEDAEAVRHIFRVASSLDSMIVGEPQILGQIKAAYQTTTRQKTSGVIINRLLHRAFFVAKKIRTETGIGDRAVSISYAAIELGKKIFDSLVDKKVLMIGAGEMAELAVEHLIRQNSGMIYVANRTFERAVTLAGKFKGKAIHFEEIPHQLQQVDIIISSTGSPDFVLTKSDVKGIMRRRHNRPLFFIDIAVPRDIDPDINRLNNIYVYDIDDLQDVIDENIEDRKKEALKAERIVDEAVIRFQEWHANLAVVPTIVALKNKIDAITKQELERTLQTIPHLSDNQRKALSKMTDAMTKKIMHDPTLLLKSDSNHINKPVYLDLTRRLFKLDE